MCWRYGPSYQATMRKGSRKFSDQYDSSSPVDQAMSWTRVISKRCYENIITYRRSSPLPMVSVTSFPTIWLMTQENIVNKKMSSFQFYFLMHIMHILYSLFYSSYDKHQHNLITKSNNHNSFFPCNYVYRYGCMKLWYLILSIFS